MRSAIKFYLIGLGGLIGILAIGMLIGALYSSPEDIKEVDLSPAWFWFRLAFYGAVILAWKSICRLVTRKKACTDLDAKVNRNEKRAADIKYLISIRWKVAVVFMFFEVIIIQQFGTRLW